MFYFSNSNSLTEPCIFNCCSNVFSASICNGMFRLVFSNKYFEIYPHLTENDNFSVANNLCASLNICSWSCGVFFNYHYFFFVMILGCKSEKCFGICYSQVFPGKWICMGFQSHHYCFRLRRSRWTILCDYFGEHCGLKVNLLCFGSKIAVPLNCWNNTTLCSMFIHSFLVLYAIQTNLYVIFIH